MENFNTIHNIPIADIKDPNRTLKFGIWIYFFLLIFEGALRKWLLPGLSAPLLIIRDPLALWLIVTTWQRGLLPRNIYMGAMVLIGISGIFTAIFFGHGNLPIAVYGARILLVHFPLIFVMGSIFNREDVIRMGKIVLWLSIPMVVLTAFQFYSPQSAWVNRGVGGDMEGAGFSGALGFFRPPGTFSFTTGNVQFFGFVSCFIFYFWLTIKEIHRFILIVATVCLLVAIPISLSRTLLFQVGVTLFFVAIAISRKPQFIGQMLIIIFGGIMTIAILWNTTFFQMATEAFTARFESASESEGGLEGTLGNRFLGGLILEIVIASEKPFFGYGLGIGTNVGSVLLSGQREFLLAEREWGRLIGELGPLLGLAIISIRCGLCIKLAVASYNNLTKGDVLPWLLLSFGFLIILQGQWAQPTTLGFSTLIGGLMVASFRKPDASETIPE